MLQLRSRRAIAAAALIAVCLFVPATIALASIDGTVSIQCQINDRRTVGLNSGVNISINPTPSITFANGTGANAANQIYQATRSLSSGTDNVDLAGSLQDSYGTTVALVRVKAIYIKNLSSANSMTFGNGTNPWATLLSSTGTVTLPPGGFLMIATPDASGWSVTASTGDILKAAGTGTDSYQIAVLGATS